MGRSHYTCRSENQQHEGEKFKVLFLVRKGHRIADAPSRIQGDD